MHTAHSSVHRALVAAQPYEQAPQALRQTSLQIGDGFAADMNQAEAMGLQAEANALDGCVGYRPYHHWAYGHP